jgi:hypothetical protein
MKDGLKARSTLEFKREAVQLVHVGEKVSAVWLKLSTTCYESLGLALSQTDMAISRPILLAFYRKKCDGPSFVRES